MSASLILGWPIPAVLTGTVSHVEPDVIAGQGLTHGKDRQVLVRQLTRSAPADDLVPSHCDDVSENSRGRRVTACTLAVEHERDCGLGLYENGVSPYGVDITAGVNFAGENVLAVHVDNSTNYVEKSSGIGFRWNSNDFNPAAACAR